MGRPRLFAYCPTAQYGPMKCRMTLAAVLGKSSDTSTYLSPCCWHIFLKRSLSALSRSIS